MKKPFNVDAAKAGAKVVTRDGRPVEILKYDYMYRGDQKIACCYTDEFGDNNSFCVNPDGYFLKGNESDQDLFIEEEPIYRPYANAVEMDEAINEHGMFVKHLLVRRLAIKEYGDNEASVGKGCTYEALLKYYTWLDVTPCGVQEGGADE